MKPLKPLTRTAARCARCRRWSNADEGTVLRNPLRLVCGVCLLRIEPEPSFHARLTRKTASGYTLFGYQVQTATRMATSQAFLNGNKMGLGKSVEACVGALRLDMPNILICPSSMKRTWSREIGEWRPDLEWDIADAKDQWARYFREIEPGHVLIGSYKLLPGDACGGCVSRGMRACAHAQEPHPAWITNGRGQPEPYHAPKGLRDLLKPRGWHPPMALPKCEGCKQRNPMPKIERPFVLLGDEIHAIKTPGSQQTIKWRALARQIIAKGGNVYGLSGTQYENHPGEGWEVLTGLGRLDRVAFGSWQLYNHLFEDYLDNPKGARSPPKGPRLNEVHIRLRRVRSNRKTEDVLKDLPPRRTQTIQVDLSAKHIKAVEEAVERMFATRKAWHDVEAGLLQNPHEPRLTDDERERRRQLYQARIDLYFHNRPWTYDSEVIEAVREILLPKNRHPGIGALSKVRRLLSLAKLQAVETWVRTCEEESEPVVLFSQHVDIIKKFGERPGWAPFHGQISDRKRDEHLVAFQEGRVHSGLAVSIGAGREGITLTRARLAGFVDLNWNPARNRQAEARVRRMGSQQHNGKAGSDALGLEAGSILYVRFIANHPVDRLVLETLAEKERLLDAIDSGSEPEFWDEGESYEDSMMLGAR